VEVEQEVIGTVHGVWVWVCGCGARNPDVPPKPNHETTLRQSAIIRNPIELGLY